HPLVLGLAALGDPDDPGAGLQASESLVSCKMMTFFVSNIHAEHTYNDEHADDADRRARPLPDRRGGRPSRRGRLRAAPPRRPDPRRRPAPPGGPGLGPPGHRRPARRGAHDPHGPALRDGRPQPPLVLVSDPLRVSPVLLLWGPDRALARRRRDR